MWFSFWKSRDSRFSLDELRRLAEELQKVRVVNDVNKDFVIEALRSIAELLTYGDQHDSSFFDFFMEKQVMEEFVRILKVSRTPAVALQLLQTVSILIQNLKNEHAIYYLFSNEHINFLITYSFDFRNEEQLSYYISFLRAIGGKLNKNTISLLVKTQDENVVSFPLYVEAMQFAFHEETMVRTAVRALTLNIYHVGDESVNRFVTRDDQADYFAKLVTFLQKQCIKLNALVSETPKNQNAESTNMILTAVDDIEDNLYYFSDVISAGVPDVERLITNNILRLLILPLLLPSLQLDAANGILVGAVPSLYLLCCIVRIVKIKDLANAIAAALFCPPEAFVPFSEAKSNGRSSYHESLPSENSEVTKTAECSEVTLSSSPNSAAVNQKDFENECDGSSHHTLRDVLLSYVTTGDDIQVLGSLIVLATLLQTKELDETMLDAIGILPQRMQHKKLLLQALVGESLGEEQLFSSENSPTRDGFSSVLYGHLQKLKENGVVCSLPHTERYHNMHRFQVLDALVNLVCRSDVSGETLWDGGWLLRQLLPYSKAEFNGQHLKLLRDTYQSRKRALLEEIRSSWSDVIITVLCHEWKNCKRAIEASSSPKEPKCILFPLQKPFLDDVLGNESSFTAGERLHDLVKVFVLLNQLWRFSLGKAIPDDAPVCLPTNIPEDSRAGAAGLDISGPKPGTELRLGAVDTVPCRISFERGKERHFSFLAISAGTSGWILLAEEMPLKPQHGVVRVAAPLAGSNPRIDEKHQKWLHLRIRPSTLPFLDPTKYATAGRVKARTLVDGRWTLAFRSEESCKSALSMILEEINSQSKEVERRIKPLIDLEESVDALNLSSIS